jgi:hypothetical protein
VYAQLFAADKLSEFAVLRHCLLQADGLKSLTLRLGYGKANEDFISGELNLRLEAEDAFPALDSLTLGHDCYD